MNSTSSPPVVRRRRNALVLLLTLVFIVIITFAVQQSLAIASSGSSGFSGFAVDSNESDEVTDADGLIPDGRQLSVFDESAPAIVNLDEALLAAVRAAAADAREDGVEFSVNSGWRSEALQAQLLQEAVVSYGSEEEAARWVATPETSSHVTGDAIDLGPWPALDWLVQHGSDYELCQTYANEPWHYELRPGAAANGCPPMYNNPTEDPRMQR